MYNDLNGCTDIEFDKIKLLFVLKHLSNQDMKVKLPQLEVLSAAWERPNGKTLREFLLLKDRDKGLSKQLHFIRMAGKKRKGIKFKKGKCIPVFTYPIIFFYHVETSKEFLSKFTRLLDPQINENLQSYFYTFVTKSYKMESNK